MQQSARPVTVLFVDNSYTFGGAINALATLLKGFRGSCIRPVVLSAQPTKTLADTFPGVRTIHWNIRLPWSGKPIHRVVRRLPGFRSGPLAFIADKLAALWWLVFTDLPQVVHVVRIARQERVGVIHLNNGVNGLLPVALAAKLLRVPMIAHARGPESTKGLRRYHTRLPSHWIAVSRSIEGNLKAAGVDPAKITVVHDGIDIARFQSDFDRGQVRLDIGVPEEALVVGIFGRIIPWKGIREFILAIAQVIPQVPALRAIIVGDTSDGDARYYDEMLDLVSELGIAQQVQFTGFRTDIPDLMRACDVVVHASTLPEPFGLTVVEGMAAGAAVVAAASGGPLEIIEHETTGLLVDPTNTEELSRAVRRLLVDANMRAFLAERGAARAVEYYELGRYAAEVSGVYRGHFGITVLPTLD